MNTYQRGELAQLCGINRETLRYYETRHLIDAPKRSSSGYRLYTEDHIRKIRFIKNAQKLGFSLKEISELLGLRVRSGKKCESVLKRAKNKKNEVEQKIFGLKQLKRILDDLIRKCEQSDSKAECPILIDLETAP